MDFGPNGCLKVVLILSFNTKQISIFSSNSSNDGVKLHLLLQQAVCNINDKLNIK